MGERESARWAKGYILGDGERGGKDERRKGRWYKAEEREEREGT